jgi:hypothetical protein
LFSASSSDIPVLVLTYFNASTGMIAHQFINLLWPIYSYSCQKCELEAWFLRNLTISCSWMLKSNQHMIKHTVGFLNTFTTVYPGCETWVYIH